MSHQLTQTVFELTPQASAQSALVLDNFKPDDGYPMSVKISDPAARQKRSDEANTKLFVGGLNAKTKEGNVRELFIKVSSVVSRGGQAS